MSDQQTAAVEPAAPPRSRFRIPKPEMSPEMRTRFMLLPELQTIVPYSVMHFYRLERQGMFPKRIKMRARRVCWDRAEVDAWVEARRAESRA